MSLPVKLTGKAGSFTFNGTQIAFKTQKPKTATDYADSTDSANYDPTSNLVHKSQLACTTQTETGIEGFFDLNTTDQVLITQLLSGAAAVPCVFNLSPTKVYGHGNFDITDLETDIPIGDMVSFSATLRSNGVFVHGS